MTTGHEIAEVAASRTQDETCKPQTHFGMLKIEKTGSSTLYTILGRFVREHNLNMISQLYGVHINFRAPRGRGRYALVCIPGSERLSVCECVSEWCLHYAWGVVHHFFYK